MDRTDFTKNCTFADEGDYVVTVSAEDKAGNKSDAQISKFRIDRTAPVITISGVNTNRRQQAQQLSAWTRHSHLTMKAEVLVRQI